MGFLRSALGKAYRWTRNVVGKGAGIAHSVVGKAREFLDDVGSVAATVGNELPAIKSAIDIASDFVPGLSGLKKASKYVDMGSSFLSGLGSKARQGSEIAGRIGDMTSKIKNHV